MWISSKKLIIIMIIVCIITIISLSTVLILTGTSPSQGVVVIDAGHGGSDGGVCNNDMKESDINLEMSKILEKELISRKYKVIQTRTDKNALADGKKNDMAERAKIINNAKPDMVISLHVNKFKDATRRGVQVFYDDTNKNKEYGVKMQEVINTYINAKYAKRTDLASLGGDYFITKCSEYPTVIVECGFISNAEDRELINKDSYRRELCKSIADSLVSIHTSFTFI